MRPIKFRAWNKSKKEMFHPGMISENSQIEHKMGFGGFELMQYTGLKDKNGVEIYEGDIIQYKSHKGYLLPDHIGELIWANVGYSISDPLGRTYDIDLWDADELEVDILDHCTIIGNIYEHPNLLQL